MGGRKKGGQNKITRDVKEAVLAAGEKHGSDGKGKDGLVGAFLHMLRKKPEAWSAIAAKCMASQHTIRNETGFDLRIIEEIEAEMKSLGITITGEKWSSITKG